MEITPPLEIPETAPQDFGVVHCFAGKKLEPFSFSRQCAAQRCGLSGDSPLESSTLLVYLCTLAPEAIDRARGEAGVRAFRRGMAEWADAARIGFGSRAAKEVTAIADAIWTAIADAQGEPEAESDGDPPNPNA